MNNQKGFAEVFALSGVALVVMLFVIGWMFAYPNYRVWSQEMRGKAASRSYSSLR